MTSSKCPIEKIVKRDGHLVNYDRDRITTAIFKAAAEVGGKDRDMAAKIAEEVEKSLVQAFTSDHWPSVEEIQDRVEATLINRGHVKTARAYIVYRAERAKVRQARAQIIEATDNIPYKKIYEVLRWNMDHGCETVYGLNRIIADGKFPELIRDCEQRYDSEVADVAKTIIERLPDVRMVIVAGPSSSGKTTTTIKAGEKLKEAGMELVAINIDHYFFDLEMHPKDEFGDYDYETPQALDLKLINQHLVRLLNGETIRTPHYDFKSGKRKLDAHELKLGKNQILLIDSLHGLYDEMTWSIEAKQKFRLYVETLGQLRNADGMFMRWADNRLLRRMIRDRWHRNLKPIQTLSHWHYVRRSELKNIIPFIGSVDTIVNSAMPFELPILKNKLFQFFPEAMAMFKDDPKRQDAYLRAKRVLELFHPMTAVTDDRCVPPRSLIREFIGGSEYRY
jgi:uridine kinase